MKLASLYLIYLAVGLLIYLYGPLSYGAKNNSIMIIFVTLCYLCLFIGMYVGYVTYKVSYSQGGFFFKGKEAYSFLMMAGLSVVFNLYTIYNLYSTVINSGIDVNIGNVYYLNMAAEKNSGIVTTLMTLFSPLNFLAISLGVKIYRTASITIKLMLWLLVGTSILSYILKGTNFGIFILVVSILISSFMYSANKSVKVGTIKRKLLYATACVLFVIVFVSAMSSRLNINYIPSTISGISINAEHFLFTILPPELSMPIAVATSYISQGYFAVSLMFDYRFDSTFGLGSGYFLLGKLSPDLSIDIFSNTYQYKMNDIWPYRSQWHTALVWLANDFSFYVVPVYCFIFGMIASVVYKQAKYNKDLVSVSLMSLISIILVFLPANNILMSNPFIFMSFFMLLFSWVFINKVRIRC